MYKHVLQNTVSFPTQALYLGEFWRFCIHFLWKYQVLRTELELLHSPNDTSEGPDTFTLYQTCQKSQLRGNAAHFLQQLILGVNLV